MQSSTSHDVARLAGVSQPTVSRALSGSAGVSTETVRKVRAAAEKLSYVPSQAGRTLSTRQTSCIGIVADELTNPFYPELIEPMRSELEHKGYRTLLVMDSPTSPLDLDKLIDGTLDGVLFTTATVSSTQPASLSSRGIPFVLVNRTVDGLHSDQCTFNNTHGASMVADHLVEQGHQQIGLISGPLHTSTGRERAEAFRDRMSAHGFEIDSQLTRVGGFSVEDGYRYALELANSVRPPTAIFCGNDVIALGAANALNDSSSRIRTSIAVVGFDGIPLVSWNLINLTTVRCDIAVMARESVRLLLRRIHNPNADPEQVVLPTELIERRRG